MNLVFFTQEDPLYVRIFFEEFLKIRDRSDRILAVVISKPMGKRSATDLARQMYGFYGPLGFLRMGARYAAAKATGRTIGRLVRSRGMRVIERSDLNSAEFIATIKGYDADMFISVASPIIFKKEILSLPRACSINIHNAPLPRYRGMMPNFWQLFHGEEKTGVTVHRMALTIDGGEAIRQEYLPVLPGETLDHLIRRTKKRNALLLKEVLDDFRAGSVTFTPIEGEGSYYTFPTKAEAREFKRRGGKLL
jgi:methionyl-tRNA formyltransferase